MNFKISKKLPNFLFLDIIFLFQNIVSCFRTTFSVLEHCFPILERPLLLCPGFWLSRPVSSRGKILSMSRCPEKLHCPVPLETFHRISCHKMSQLFRTQTLPGAKRKDLVQQFRSCVDVCSTKQLTEIIWLQNVRFYKFLSQIEYSISELRQRGCWKAFKKVSRSQNLNLKYLQVVRIEKQIVCLFLDTLQIDIFVSRSTDLQDSKVKIDIIFPLGRAGILFITMVVCIM